MSSNYPVIPVKAGFQSRSTPQSDLTTEPLGSGFRRNDRAVRRKPLAIREEFPLIDNESGTNAQLAQEGMRHIENAILELLFRNPQGLRNVQIANMLGLSSEFRGEQRNFLTYAVLGRLLAQGRILRNEETKTYTVMNADTVVQEGAQAGLQLLQESVLRLLEQNPQGLRNVEIANSLILNSEFQGRQRNRLTHAILGGLMAQGRITWNEETKIFTLS